MEVGCQGASAVKVAAGYALHDSPGGSYRRASSSKRRMGSDALRRQTGSPELLPGVALPPEPRQRGGLGAAPA